MAFLPRRWLAMLAWAVLTRSTGAATRSSYHFHRHSTVGSPCGYFPVDAANRLGACVTHHAIRITDERKLYIRLVVVPGSESVTGDFLSGPHYTEELSLVQISACIDTPPPCRILLLGTNIPVGVARSPDDVYVGLGPTSAVWDTWSRVEISVRNQRATVFQRTCADACSSIVSDLSDPAAVVWQTRSPTVDAVLLGDHDALIVTDTHIGIVNPEYEELIDRKLPQSLAWVILVTAFTLALVAVGIERVYYPWRGWLPNLLLSVLALQVVAWLGLVGSPILSNMDRYFYWISANAWHTYGWHLVIALPVSWCLAVGLLIWKSWEYASLVMVHVVHIELTLVLSTFLTDIRHQPQPFIAVFTLAHVWQLYGMYRASDELKRLPWALGVLHTILALWFEATHGQNLLYGLCAQVLELPEYMACRLTWIGLSVLVIGEIAASVRVLQSKNRI